MIEKFHAGEIFVQKKANVHEAALALSNMIGEQLPFRSIPFIETQNLIIISACDAEDRPWTFTLVGDAGFVHSKDGSDLEISLSDYNALSTQLRDLLLPGARLGILFIDLLTRIRLRVNGQINSISDKLIRMDILQAYPNCPKYIQKRKLIAQEGVLNEQVYQEQSGERIEGDLEKVIKGADTFFVGSSNTNNEFDASHRGGHPGFVEIMDQRTIRIPDYPGNNLFNTLGNIHANPKAGLLFIDFESNTQYHLTGTAKVVFDVQEEVYKTGGTQRWWHFKIEKWFTTQIHHSFKWDFVSNSPYLP